MNKGKITVAGPAGCGKTCLIQLLTRAIVADSRYKNLKHDPLTGTITVEGASFNGDKVVWTIKEVERIL